MSCLSESFLSEIPKKASESFLSEDFLPKVFRPKVFDFNVAREQQNCCFRGNRFFNFVMSLISNHPFDWQNQGLNL